MARTLKIECILIPTTENPTHGHSVTATRYLFAASHALVLAPHCTLRTVHSFLSTARSLSRAYLASVSVSVSAPVPATRPIYSRLGIGPSFPTGCDIYPPRLHPPTHPPHSTPAPIYSTHHTPATLDPNCRAFLALFIPADALGNYSPTMY
ncbi:hypothetical protein BD413DRAFT_283829 [Trametes elegans]|nr:hypothetical protein BD413DRAFT_283829 [Trametes elegans]